MEIPRTLTEFEQTYYYKTELIHLCQLLKLPTSGTKAELNSYIKKYLNGVPVNQITVVRRRKAVRALTYQEISLETKLVNSGFSFNKAARRWFADYFGVNKFSFSKTMAIIKRKAEVEHDTEITVGDLIQQMQKWNQNNTNTSAEENTYQWNRFVRDFFNDPETIYYNQRLKVAAFLWGKVRTSKKSKVYYHDLLKKYGKELQIYRN